MDNYNFKQVEKKWRDYWINENVFAVTEDESIPKDKRLYVLDMFPYPSGAGLHVGHPEGYTASDIFSRYKRMNGFHVLHPIGFDSFGLPAENYAVKTGIHPQKTTAANIDNIIDQLKRLGLSYDWRRLLATSEADYYRWTQWIFLQLFNKGLAYLADAPINWCDSCKTGLANEEVIQGCCERCGNPTGRRFMKQWHLRITDYAERLLAGLEGLDWPNSIKKLQTNWIGRSQGSNITFPLSDVDGSLEVFTTRPDTLYGATYMVLAPEHPLTGKITSADKKQQVNDYCLQSSRKSDLERTDLNKDKSGVFTGGYAINPVNLAKIPIWISDYILISYGTGAIMAVPAHDERDFEFARKYDLPVIPVVADPDRPVDAVIDGASMETAFVGEGVAINSGEFDGLSSEQMKKAVNKKLADNGCGQETINYRLRDWIYSRQRYWGEPIPLVHCPECGIVPLPESELPLLLPPTENFKPISSGESPLARLDDWLRVDCPQCGGAAQRETNTMPQWAGSCWYYMRYTDPNNEQKFAGRDRMDYWLPVDLYIGGAEHAVLHLLYARFWHMFLYDQGLVGCSEPFSRLINQGTILGEDKAKMSKSAGNTVNPDDIIRDYGADALRLYEMFMGPLTVSKPWSTGGIDGIFRFINRVWRLYGNGVSDEAANAEELRLLHRTIKKVTEDTETIAYNTAISQMMIFINGCYKLKSFPRELAETFALLISPYAPHLAEELWQQLGHEQSLAYEKWPEYDPKLARQEMITVVVQINGKLRAKLEVAPGTERQKLIELAGQQPKIVEYLAGKTTYKTVAVVDRMVNFVVK